MSGKLLLCAKHSSPSFPLPLSGLGEHWHHLVTSWAMMVFHVRRTVTMVMPPWHGHAYFVSVYLSPSYIHSYTRNLFQFSNIILILLSSSNSGYLHRFSKMGKKSGDTVYLIAAQWFRTWQEYTHYQMVYCPASLLHSGSVINVSPFPSSLLSLSLPGDRSFSLSAHLKEGQEEDQES